MPLAQKKTATTLKEPPSVSKKPTPGSMSHYRMAVTNKRKKPSAEPYPKKKPDRAQAKSKVKDLEEETPAVHMIDVGLLVYKDNALVKTPTIFNINQMVDLSDPDLFEKLPTTLWKTFSKDIPNNTSIRHRDLPKDPKPFLTLLHSKSRLTNLEALLFIIRKNHSKKGFQLDLAYRHPDMTISPVDSEDACSEISEVPRKKAPTSKSKPSQASSSSESTHCSVVLQKKQAPSKSKHGRAPSPCESTELTYPKEIHEDKHQAASDRASAWASGGVALPSSSSLLINDHGWLNGYRLEYDTCGKAATNTNAAPQYPWLQAECQPITFKIYRQCKIGQGSMREAFKADVKSIDSDGSVKIIEYVAKVRPNDLVPDIQIHSADALMYQASALLLEEFKKELGQCHRLGMTYRKKCVKLQIAWHAVVIEGSIDDPKQIYFFEKALKGPYVKYSSNMDFKLNKHRDGVDPSCSIDGRLHTLELCSHGWREPYL
ncbi:hypothetical protein PSHT_14813 [Puccinia striiformis]|uniref:Alpha-type protein kinase domain-containing protein n=1 Tax=Puccinia striiformis TaxID=27350 RepID=A0A2S4UI96_9BASI|nr:hypothetical protein PSHT_14813 [Puccinia striiformis]